MTLRKKAAYSYALAFVVLWAVCGTLLFLRFRSEIQGSFDEQMRARAMIVAERTNIDPRVVPLPQGEENFFIYYESDGASDQLFAPPSPDDRLMLEQRHVEVSVETEDGEGVLRIVYSLPSTDVDRTIRTLFLILLLLFSVGLFFSFMLGYWLSGKIIGPVKQVIRLANETDILHLVALLDEPQREDELKDLIVSFNRMLFRIRTQSEQQNAFFASASHELRTPLSVMQTHLQVMLQDPDLDEANRCVYRDQLREVRRMIKMVNDFLLMSELKGGTVRVSKSGCELLEMAMAAFARNKERMQERDVRFKVSLVPMVSPFTVWADEDKLRIILGNLVENAVKYAARDSLIRLELIEDEEKIVFTVKNKIRSDISPDIEAIQGQFYHSKPLQGEGSGLGLWISGQLASMQDMELTFSMADDCVFCADLRMDGFTDPVS